jgi:antitoxin ParD1/3/4
MGVYTNKSKFVKESIRRHLIKVNNGPAIVALRVEQLLARTEQEPVSDGEPYARLEFLKALMDTDGAATGIKALADDLECDYRLVHDDVVLPNKNGLLFTVEDGRAKRPFVPYRRIHLDIELVAAGEESVPA